MLRSSRITGRRRTFSKIARSSGASERSRGQRHLINLHKFPLINLITRLLLFQSTIISPERWETCGGR